MTDDPSTVPPGEEPPTAEEPDDGPTDAMGRPMPASSDAAARQQTLSDLLNGEEPTAESREAMARISETLRGVTYGPNLSRVIADLAAPKIGPLFKSPVVPPLFKGPVIPPSIAAAIVSPKIDAIAIDDSIFEVESSQLRHSCTSTAASRWMWLLMVGMEWSGVSE